MLTEETVKKNYPTSKPDVVKALISSLGTLAEKYGLSSPLRLSHFLAQTAHESGGFRLIEENLNYSADGLNKIFPKYFVKAGRDAQAYHRQPEKIANVVYASRMGNGDTASGEGYKFRGRGYIQLTGKDNYTRFGAAIGENITSNPDVVSGKYALLSAAWFWSNNGLNKLADGGATDATVTSITKRVNGGTIGLADRIKHFKEYYHLLA